MLEKMFGPIETASAHCDIPCGVYDARTVMYHAVSTLRQIDILLSLKDKGLSETAFAMQVARNTAEKEKQAELVKHEVRVIWGLVALCNEFSEMFWDMKGIKTKTAPCPYAPNVDVVIPAL